MSRTGGGARTEGRGSGEYCCSHFPIHSSWPVLFAVVGVLSSKWLIVIQAVLFCLLLAEVAVACIASPMAALSITGGTESNWIELDGMRLTTRKASLPKYWHIYGWH